MRRFDSPQFPGFPANCGPNVAPLEPIGRRALLDRVAAVREHDTQVTPVGSTSVTELASRSGCFGFLKAKISAQGKGEDAPWDAIDVTRRLQPDLKGTDDVRPSLT